MLFANKCVFSFLHFFGVAAAFINLFNLSCVRCKSLYQIRDLSLRLDSVPLQWDCGWVCGEYHYMHTHTMHAHKCTDRMQSFITLR